METNSNVYQIWQGCLRNDRKQQELLYRTSASKMLAVCRKYCNDRDEAEDILQEGFIKIFHNIQKFRGEGSMKGWIRRIMVHTAISRFRKLKLMILTDDFSNGDFGMDTARNEHGLEAKDLLKLIQLPQTYCSVFNLHAIEGYSHQEISSQLGMTELLSRTTLHRARMTLQNKVSKMTVINA